MRKIIKNKVYDTDTARLCGTRNISAQAAEALYWKKSGEFFASTVDTATGEHIRPLTYYAAKAWAAENLPSEKYGEIFGAENTENDEKTKITRLCLRPSTIAKLRREAARRGITIGGLVDQLAEDF